jgi:hypothetical protein
VEFHCRDGYGSLNRERCSICHSNVHLSANGRLCMRVSSQVQTDKCTSQRGAMNRLTTFIRRIIVREGVIESFTQEFLYPSSSERAWISSSICVLPQTYVSNCKSLTSITFESSSKLHRIDESAFALSGLMTIHLPSSAELLCKSCFSQLRVTYIDYI